MAEIPKEPDLMDMYVRGYRDGYQRGLEDGRTGIVCADEAVLQLPVEAMGLSTRACVCLTRAGCRSIRDAALLSTDRIERTRRLGKVTAREIATALNRLGIVHTLWDRFLVETLSIPESQCL